MNEIIYPPGCKDIQIELANDELIRRLKKIQQTFQNFSKDPSLDKYKQLSVLLGSDVFVEHEHDDVKLLIACCLADIIRLYAPDLPYQDPKNLKKIFILLANQLKGLNDKSKTAYNRYHYLLENLRQDNKFLLCLDLEDSQEIIADVFEVAFKIINDKTDANVRLELFELLFPLLNESDHLSCRVLDTLFARIIEPQKSNNKEAYNLASNLIKKGNENFEFLVQNHLNNTLLTSRGNSNLKSYPQITSAMNASVSSDESFNTSLNADKTTTSFVHGQSNQFISDKLCLIIYELYSIRYALLELVLPQLEYKLKSNDLKERREYTKLLSKMFSEKESALAQKVPHLWEAYLERFSDANEDIRKICVQHICDFLIQQSTSIKSIGGSHSSSTIADSASFTSINQNGSSVVDQIIEIIKNRSLDSEESIRFEVVQEILKAIKQDSNLITLDILNVLKERTLDVKIKVRKSALQGLAALYKKIHSKINVSRSTVQVVNWIPSKIMRIFFQESTDDKLLVERLLNSSIVPYSMDAKEKMAKLYYAFTTFDEYSIMSLMEIMKNRVFLNTIMKSLIEKIEENPKIDFNDSHFNEIILISQQLLDASKGHDFMKVFLNTLKTNHNVRNYFKNLVNVNNSCSKSLQLIQLILTNLGSLNQSHSNMAKRLIERMSSIIIDKECIERLIDLIEYKVRQRLTLKQRRLMSKKSRKNDPKTSSRKGRKGKLEESSGDDENSESEMDEEVENVDNDEQNMDSFEADEEIEDNETIKSSEVSNPQMDRLLIRHVDDDGEKGIKLLNYLFLIHNNYGFNNSNTYQKLFNFINSRKDNVVSATIKLLNTFYSTNTRSKEQTDEFNTVNDSYLNKLKHFCLHGKSKQAKHSINLIYKNFEHPKNQNLLYDIYKELLQEAENKNAKTFITCLVSLGHICISIPKLVGKEIKEFISKIVKDILMQPLDSSNFSLNETSALSATKRKNNLKLAGKWCENEDELPISTRVKLEAIKLVVRWCLGLKSECSNILFTIRILIKLIMDNAETTSKSTNNEDSDESKIIFFVSEAERSRIRATCASQLIKLAQEPCFKQLITAEYFHILAKLIIDPVNNVREIIIKKLTKALKSNKLPYYYMGIFALSGLDTNKERKAKVKKIFTSLIKQYRQYELNETKQQTSQKTARILPEMCLPYSVSLMAHNIKIDSLKDDQKVKQIKECLSVILEPLIENPDGYQIALIKKILNKIKSCDDGLASVAVSQSAKLENKAAFQNLYIFNKSLVFICEIFLFHIYSKTTNYLTNKECQFDVNLPVGFFTPRESGSEDKNTELNKEVEELFTKSQSEKKAEDQESENNENSVEITEISEESKKHENTRNKSSIQIIPIGKKRKAQEDSKKNEREDSDDEDMVLSDIRKSLNSQKDASSQENSKISDESVSSPVSKKRLIDSNLSDDKKSDNQENDDKIKSPSRPIRSTRSSKLPSSTMSPVKKTKKSTESEEEKENEIEKEKEIDTESRENQNLDDEHKSEEIIEENDEKKATRSSGRQIIKKNKNQDSPQTRGRKSSIKTSTDSPSYSLRQKRTHNKK